jgi:hypothetical protein
MKANVQRTFLYHAHGSALGGFITRPFCEAIEPVASLSLPVSGGYGSVQVSDYHYRKLITVKHAQTQVSGSQAKDGSYNTLITTTIEGLNVADMIHADRIVARITTHHDGGDGETSVVTAGSEFFKLRIAGEDVKFDLDHSLTQHATFAEYKKNVKGFQESKGMIRCSLIKNLGHSFADKEGRAVIQIPHFGTIYLGEVYMREGRRQLTMLRLELGSPVGGSVALGGGDGNGNTYP